ncbi:type II toxin-antitoxin system Phd/YefM family antitoxin [Synechococcus sp. HK01-R]|uniref:type II toxin-antitoxin system Phd/YefM family antitoxin n=1 Tax=Synechococcus sp. HK01-R TaxID=2751171 RepID=UPI00210223AD|nr:type II toxin-antitoxin system prevent-host-death family antitoxin [Synechococcus sp. HK01-R]
MFCPDGLPTAELPKHLTASKWARGAAIKGDSQVPVPTANWSWNQSEQFATPNGAACFINRGQHLLRPWRHQPAGVHHPGVGVSGGSSSAPAAAITEISWKGMRCNLEESGGGSALMADLRLDGPGGPRVATKPRPFEDGGARLLVGDDALEGKAVTAVLVDGNDRVIAQRRTVVGGRRGMSAEIRPNVVALAKSVVSEVVASQVSVRDLKTHLSEWLSRVQAGEEVEVTSHRKPIARITAVKPAAPAPTSPLQKAIDAGLISWNGQNPVIPPPVKLNDGGPLMSDIVIEDRG